MSLWSQVDSDGDGVVTRSDLVAAASRGELPDRYLRDDGTPAWGPYALAQSGATVSELQDRFPAGGGSSVNPTDVSPAPEVTGEDTERDLPIDFPTPTGTPRERLLSEFTDPAIFHAIDRDDSGTITEQELLNVRRSNAPIFGDMNAVRRLTTRLLTSGVSLPFRLPGAVADADPADVPDIGDVTKYVESPVPGSDATAGPSPTGDGESMTLSRTTLLGVALVGGLWVLTR